MSKVHLVSFSDSRMSISQQQLTESAYKFGVDDVHAYREYDLPDWFTRMQSEVMQHERGYGFWAWKPWIVADAIHEINIGDCLIYCDAGNEFISSLQPILRTMAENESDVFLFSNGWPHVDWCKGDTLKAILGWNYAECEVPYREKLWQSWREHKQVQASTIFFRVSNYSRSFCKEWLAWSLMPGLIDNEDSTWPNAPTFREHRHDQAIIASMAIRRGIKLHWFPTTTALHIRKEHPGDYYDAILRHHRKRNDEWE